MWPHPCLGRVPWRCGSAWSATLAAVARPGAGGAGGERPTSQGRRRDRTRTPGCRVGSHRHWSVASEPRGSSTSRASRSTSHTPSRSWPVLESARPSGRPSRQDSLLALESAKHSNGVGPLASAAAVGPSASSRPRPCGRARRRRGAPGRARRASPRASRPLDDDRQLAGPWPQSCPIMVIIGHDWRARKHPGSGRVQFA